MQDIYTLSGVSKQGHHQAFKREQAWLEKMPSYIGLMEEIREIHPAMGLRTMYEMTQPEGIGRDAFIVLGLQSGFRLQVVSNPTRTTFSMPSRRYPNLLLHREFTDVNQIWACSALCAITNNQQPITQSSSSPSVFAIITHAPRRGAGISLSTPRTAFQITSLKMPSGTASN